MHIFAKDDNRLYKAICLYILCYEDCISLKVVVLACEIFWNINWINFLLSFSGLVKYADIKSDLGYGKIVRLVLYVVVDS